jgi:hypothetical protein
MTEKTAEPMPDAGPGLAPAERRLLAAMPLHAITSVHGETGLRERQLMEIAPAQLPGQLGEGEPGGLNVVGGGIGAGVPGTEHDGQRLPVPACAVIGPGGHWMMPEGFRPGGQASGQ